MGPGFDVLGFALHEPGDEVILYKVPNPGVIIKRITGDTGRLPLDPTLNAATVPMLAYLDAHPCGYGFEIEVHKKMPLGSGLGSSAASSVAGVFALNQLLGEPLSRSELLRFALEGERVACGTAHADNAAACLMGGFTLVRSNDPPDIIPLVPGLALYAAVVHPHIEIRTEDSRRIMKTYVTLEKAVVQWGNVAGLAVGILNGDAELIRRSMHDVIVEPTRSVLIPGFDRVKHAALEAGALGCSISGSGPSIFALCTELSVAQHAGRDMQEAFAQLGLQADLYISEINRSGPRVVD